MKQQRFDSGPASCALKQPDAVRPGRARPLLMMVDDDPNDRRIYGDVLCYNGYDVVLAGTVREALDRVERYDPDLVLLDMGLPDGSGLDVCAEFSRRSDRPLVPIIVLSAFAQSEMETRAIDAGCAVYIEKPASPVHVLHHIEQLIGRAPLPGEGRPPRTIPSADA